MTAAIFITNDSAQLIASCVILDSEAQQLVAAVIPYTTGANHAELLKAIKASLMTNAERWLTIRGEALYRTEMVKGARQKYTTCSASMQDAGAEGRVEIWLHPAAGNPQETSLEFFYLLATPEQSYEQLFNERLNLAIPWPVQPAWTDMVFTAATNAGMIQPLPMYGQSPYAVAWRIEKDPEKWKVILNQALTDNQIAV